MTSNWEGHKKDTFLFSGESLWHKLETTDSALGRSLADLITAWAGGAGFQGNLELSAELTLIDGFGQWRRVKPERI